MIVADHPTARGLAEAVVRGDKGAAAVLADWLAEEGIAEAPWLRRLPVAVYPLTLNVPTLGGGQWCRWMVTIGSRRFDCQVENGRCYYSARHGGRLLADAIAVALLAEAADRIAHQPKKED